MHPNAAAIDRFYRAFAARDGAAMATLYAGDATFSDPVFPALNGREPGAMWRMLCEAGKDLVIEHRDVEADDERGSAHWEARYTFSATGRKVHNVIDASFRFRDGLVIEHVDRFDAWAWSRQALGVSGWLLGWSDVVQGKVRAQAAKGLKRWMEANP